MKVAREPARIIDSTELERGFNVQAPGNSVCRISVDAEPPKLAASISRQRFAKGDAWLSDLDPYAAQRGIGLPEVIFVRDRSFRGKPLRLGDQVFEKGLGLAANTVVIYRLDNRHSRLKARFAVDPDAAEGDPKPSAYLTIFVDGRCKYTSGPTLYTTPVRDVDVDLNGGRMLVIRMSGNWDDNGDISNDFANLAEARLTELTA